MKQPSNFTRTVLLETALKRILPMRLLIPNHKILFPAQEKPPQMRNKLRCEGNEKKTEKLNN